ncbi:unnamed protein product [Hymenolepis diminuta]|uniref:Uncharacterized protein n=1 Tax=Hymenolepis diminuta TaxID=6216 RepID=A0A564YDU2_HYMDI|nr:unnamed protein product [Hymenolepis diminuta]
MCEIANLIVTPGSLRINIVLPSSGLFLSIAKAKFTSDDSCRCTADSAMLRNQSRPHCPFPFLQPSRIIKVRIQLCPHPRPHPG